MDSFGYKAQTDLQSYLHFPNVKLSRDYLFSSATLIVHLIDFFFYFFAKLEKYINWPLPGLISPCYTRFNPFESVLAISKEKLCWSS